MVVGGFHVLRAKFVIGRAAFPVEGRPHSDAAASRSQLEAALLGAHRIGS